MTDLALLKDFAALDQSNSEAFILTRDDMFGRYPVAKRDLKVGEVILEETPLSWAPMLDTKPVCLTCLNDVSGSFHCPVCGWPMCNKKCAKAAVHKEIECSVFSKAKVKISCDDWDYDSPQLLYNLITILRVMKLKENERNIAASMEHHLEKWKAKEDFKAKYKSVVEYAKHVLKLDVSEDEILKIITNSYTNDFSHTFPSGNQVHLMFPLTAMLNHSCFPNISRSIHHSSEGFEMRVVASRPIKEGEQIFNSYTDVLDPVQVRRKHLKETKNMLCMCERCKDPRDMGAFGSAILCLKCKGPVIPCIDVEDSWKCDKCDFQMSTNAVDKLVFDIEAYQKELLTVPKMKKIDKIEKFIKKSLTKLDSRNLLITRLKYNLLALYGRERGFTSEEMTENTWLRKKQLCEEILDTLKVLEPGLTVRKARLMYELHLPIIMLAQISLNKNKNKVRIKLLRLINSNDSRQV